MVWRVDGPQGAESKKIVWEVAPFLRGRGIDLGSGGFKILPQAISVDNMDHAAQFGHVYRPDIVCDAERLDIFASQSLDWVFSSHLLEHIDDYKAALREWWRVVKQGGKLVLYLPHKKFYPNMGQPGANPTHRHDFLPDDIVFAMTEIATQANQFDLLECQDRNEDEEYSMLLVFKKIQGKRPEYSYQKRVRPAKSCLVCRFGAFGDLMQASSVFAGLKRQGYHITLMTSLPGAEVISQDPNIDEIMLLDKDQVPNPHLTQFWAWQAKKYDKFVNLSESVEGTLLAMPGRAAHFWPPAVRHSMLNRNYLEFQHALAGVPHEPRVKFYATPEERAWARKERAKMGEFVVMWSLSGSSMHKMWAGQDSVIAALMLNHPEVDVVLVGGPETAILEAGWENEARVHRTCGKWTIRQSLAFIAEANLVIGPETGVLNAASHEDVPKIVLLSHSTEENLTRDWVHTTSISGRGVTCPGRGSDEAPACHNMVYGWDGCRRDELTSTAACQAAIPADEVYYHADAIINIGLRMLRDKETA